MQRAIRASLESARNNNRRRRNAGNSKMAANLQAAEYANEGIAYATGRNSNADLARRLQAEENARAFGQNNEGRENNNNNGNGKLSPNEQRERNNAALAQRLRQEEQQAVEQQQRNDAELARLEQNYEERKQERAAAGRTPPRVPAALRRARARAARGRNNRTRRRNNRGRNNRTRRNNRSYFQKGLNAVTGGIGAAVGAVTGAFSCRRRRADGTCQLMKRELV